MKRVDSLCPVRGHVCLVSSEKLTFCFHFSIRVKHLHQDYLVGALAAEIVPACVSIEHGVKVGPYIMASDMVSFDEVCVSDGATVTKGQGAILHRVVDRAPDTSLFVRCAGELTR